MGGCRIRVEENFLGGGSDALEQNIKKIIAYIKAKSPETRTIFERDLLKFYNSAKGKGEDFCKAKIKEAIKRKVKANRLIVLIGSVLLLIVIFRGLVK